MDRCKGEQKDFGIDLPKRAAGDKAFSPAFRRARIKFSADAGFFGADQAHALEFLERVSRLEYAFLADFDAPIAAWFA